jgi:TatD DNase family protein
MFVDTHAHITMKQYDSDRDAVVQRAHGAGVRAIIDVGLDLRTNRRTVEYARTQPGVFPIIGFHPHEASDFDANAFQQQINEYGDEVIALGEFGLDHFKEYSPKHLQKHMLEQVLAMSTAAHKPVIIHCREAEHTIMPMLRAAANPLPGVMHCFSGDVNFLKQVLDLGMHISVGGPATYPKSERLESVLKAVPRDRLLLETDCPYLSPQKFRGKRNEPAYIPLIAARIGEIWGAPAQEVGRITTNNAIKLFNLPEHLFSSQPK